MTTISVITPTFRREDLLARCVQSVLGQQADAAIEHIVVNDAGEPLTRASWMNDPRVQVVHTFRAERSFARNAGAALSRGDWLYFLDDDDYALPGAFAALLALAARSPDAAHLYGGYRVLNETDGTQQDVTPTVGGPFFAAMIAGEALPPQASWVRRDAFFAVGGFDPLLVPGEDVDLFRRVALVGPLAGTTEIVAAVRVEHPDTTTTDDRKKTDMWRRSSDKCLSHPLAYAHIARQTRPHAHLAGRVAREYLISALRHMKARQFSTAGSRLLSAAGVGLRHLPAPDFRRGLRKQPPSAG